MSEQIDHQPSVLISIVSMKSTRDVVNCLGCLSESNYGHFAVYIHENGGKGALAPLCEAMIASPSIEEAGQLGADTVLFKLRPGGQRVVVHASEENLGYAGGTNRALRQDLITDWDAVWVLNPDTFPDPLALEALVERQRMGGYGIVGSRIVFEASRLVQTWGGLRWLPLIGRARLLGFAQKEDVHPQEDDVERSIDFIHGCSMYVTRAYIEAVGGMDEEFFCYAEDTEWCLRADRRFRFGYAHGSLVRHIHGGSTGANRHRGKRSRFNVYMNERNKVLLARKRMGAAAMLVWPIYLCITTEYLLIGRSLTTFGHAVAGWLAGVRGEVGRPHWMR